MRLMHGAKKRGNIPKVRAWERERERRRERERKNKGTW